ncbi:MFS general substrate transporter [Cryphonectria parasitica EP155]|uniref:MFS general substrate transporter n=1 Tax=Cryphonectria parasitica (strain ATCC 38755 / EP155) TaxID=660469 RepID=A0A9P4XXZ9_CRYP1|nr:MFS general substrate transporter [Cryphonectria parasitica EP155]KAF3762941.1 MFS general substrate transporter [Cryphonectria parasitica EP155]
MSRPESTADYTGVLIPLDRAHLHSHSARCGQVEYEEDRRVGSAGSGVGRGRGGGRRDEGAAMLEMSAAEYSIEGLRREVRREMKRTGGGIRSAYEMKSMIINKAVQDIGMGRYNWQLFVLCGFGWFADNLWMQGVSLILPSLSAEFSVSEKQVRYTTSWVYLGLCLGAFTWGLGSDILGRRIAFNATLLITAVFGLLVSLAPSWPAVCFLLSLLGFGVGGNLPVDGALFLEFLPDASSSLLTLLSVWWPVGQLASSILAWFFIGSWPADQGWRRFVLSIGLITLTMFALRFFVFRLLESPKYLLSRGRQPEAVAVVHGLAYRNRAKTWLTEDILDAVVLDDDDDNNNGLSSSSSSGSARGVLKARLEGFSAARLRPLFSSRRLGLATILVWFCWATIGMGYPLFNAFLPQYLSHHQGDTSSSSSTKEATATTNPAAVEISPETYRDYAILSVVGVPGSVLAYFAVDSPSPFLGRKGTLALSTLISAGFLLLFVSYGKTGTSQLVFSCVEAFSQNIMYGVLYAFTPEIFPAPVRGAGTGVASFLNRITGLIAPMLAASIPGDGTTTPIYLAAALIFAAFVGMVLIPIETRGRQRL